MIVLEAGALTMLLIEGIKWLIAWRTGNPTFNFPPVFFKVAVPVLNALMPFVLVYVFGQASTDPILTMDVVGILRYVLSVAVGSLITFMGYTTGLKPLKVYSQEYLK